MDDEFVQSIKEFYKNETYNSKIVDDLFTEIDQYKANVQAQVKDFKDKRERALQENHNIVSQFKEVEQLYDKEVKHINELEAKLEEKNAEIKHLQDLKKQYLLRRDKAKAKLSQKDVNFMKSIENRLLAYKHLTGVTWDYRKCTEDHVEGYITDLVNHKMKFFSGYPDPDELWQKIKDLVENKVE